MQKSSLTNAKGHGNINMREARIVLDQQMLEEMHAHAISTYPEECCGLMFGSFSGNAGEKKVLRLRRMKNAFEPKERYHRYTIDPKEFLNAEKEADERGDEIIGVYHSHPNAPAKPSEFDRGHAWPTLSYVVIEVRERKALETKSWVLKEDRSEFVPEELQIAINKK
ncbi:MAG: M67 family metallopeptidase [archaeon]|nr:M67 family metallopeptidase [archaeon]